MSNGIRNKLKSLVKGWVRIINPCSYIIFPTGSNEVITVISIPSNLFGEYLKPGSVNISTGSIVLQDDGLGNLLHGVLKVGDVIYEHGIITITNSGTTLYSSTLPNIFYSGSLTCSFESTVTIYETQYKCTIRENEFNFSNNPSLLQGSLFESFSNAFSNAFSQMSLNMSSSFFSPPGNGKLNNNVTGSYFSPYITTVGLYNNNKELLAVAKLAQPLPISLVTDTTILINIDN